MPLRKILTINKYYFFTFLFLAFISLQIHSEQYNYEPGAGHISDQQIKDLIIAESITTYQGSCPCPYTANRAGRRCGKTSAYTKPGGASPFCYHRDISEEMIERYKRTRNLR